MNARQSVLIAKRALGALVFVLGTALALTTLWATVVYALAALAVATSLWFVGLLLALALFGVFFYLEWTDV